MAIHATEKNEGERYFICREWKVGKAEIGYNLDLKNQMDNLRNMQS